MFCLLIIALISLSWNSTYLYFRRRRLDVLDDETEIVEQRGNAIPTTFTMSKVPFLLRERPSVQHPAALWEREMMHFRCLELNIVPRFSPSGRITTLDLDVSSIKGYVGYTAYANLYWLCRQASYGYQG